MLLSCNNLIRTPNKIRHRFYFLFFSNSNEVHKRNVINSRLYSSKSFIEKWNVIHEGSAEILIPKGEKVFYNPEQLVSRDMTVAVMEWYAQNILQEEPERTFSVLEPFAASGLRSIRFAKEVPRVTHVITNDFSVPAFENIRENIEHNGLKDVIEATNENAYEVLCKRRLYCDRFDMIDIDPYGTASNFIDGAVQSLKNGGLLCISCTDSKTFSGLETTACWSRYQSIPIHKFAMKEQRYPDEGTMSSETSWKNKNLFLGLRIVLHAISISAARHGLYIEPQLSVNFGFYIRLFVKVNYGKGGANESAKKHIHAKYCRKCSSFSSHALVEERENEDGKLCVHPVSNVPETCPICDSPLQTGGPFWGGPLHNQDLVNGILSSMEERPSKFAGTKWMLGILGVLSEEIHDAPFYYISDRLAGYYKKNSLRLSTIGDELEKLGYNMSSFHGVAKAVKTNAPSHVFMNLIEELSNRGRGDKSKEASSRSKRKFARNPKKPKEWITKKKVPFKYPPLQ